MSRKFTITTPTNLSRADAQGRVQVEFTVANTSGAPERRLFRVAPLGDAKETWLSLAGENERAFAADGVHQLSVTAAVPPGTPAGRYGFRLDCIAATRAGEEIEEGPAVYFDVAASKIEPKSKAWIWIAAAVVVLIGGALTWLLTRPTEAKSDPVAKVNAPADMIEVADVATSQLDAADAIRKLQELGFRTKLKFDQNDDVKVGSVFAQSVPANSRAARGSAIELTVATSEEDSMSLSEADEQDLSASGAQALHEFFLGQQRIDVANVTGRNLKATEAIQLLQVAGFRVVLKGDPQTTATPGTVVSQKPDPNTELRVGTPVTLFVATKGDADLTLSPEEQAHLDPQGQNRLNGLFRAMEPPPAPLAPMAFVVLTPVSARPVTAIPVTATSTTVHPPQP